MTRFISTVAAAIALSASALVFAEPATSAPATAPETKPAETAPAKRAAALPINGKADPKAPGYIILFENNIDAKTEVARLEKLYGFKATHVYSMQGFQGFAGVIPAAAIEKLRWELSIRSIEHDGVATTNGGGMGAN